MGEIPKIHKAVTTTFYDRDPNTVERIGQVIFHVSETALHREGSNDFALAHLGWERPRTARISRGRAFVFWTNAGQFGGPFRWGGTKVLFSKIGI